MPIGYACALARGLAEGEVMSDKRERAVARAYALEEFGIFFEEKDQDTERNRRQARKFLRMYDAVRAFDAANEEPGTADWDGR